MEAGAKQPRGLMPRRFNGETIAQAFAEAEKIRHQLERTADQLESLDRTQLRGEAFSRAETVQAPAGGGLAETQLGPAPGAYWDMALVAASVPAAAAPRTIVLYLGSLGDTSRPIGFVQTGAGAEGTTDVRTVGVTQIPTSRGVYARFLGLAAGEVGILHIAGREYASA